MTLRCTYHTNANRFERGTEMTHMEFSTLLQAPEHERIASGYDNTAREIASQPELWPVVMTRTMESLATLASVKERGPVLLSGAGSSHYVGLAIVPALRRTGYRAEAIPSTEILTDPESTLPREPFTLVSFARSGNSPEGNAVVKLAQKLRNGQANQLAITCNPEGELGRLVRELPGNSGSVLQLPEKTNDRSLAMTASYTSMVIAGMALAYTSRPDEYRAMVQGLSSAAQTILPEASALACSLGLTQYPRVFFLASRPMMGAALESALKVQELSAGHIVAKAEDTLGFRHGFMAALDPDSLVVFFMSSDPYRRRYEIDLLKEIRTKGLGRKLVAVSEEDSSLKNLCDELLVWPRWQCDDDRNVLAAMFGQLLGFYSCLAMGLKPDNPSPQGVISRVVQGVTIYPYAEQK